MSNPFGTPASQGPVEDDLSNVNENPPLPEEGWHRARVVSVVVTKSKKGDDMRVIHFRLPGGEFDDITEYMAIGSRGKGGEIAVRNYKGLARCCGVTENDEGEFKFTTSDLEGEELYVRLFKEEQAGYAPKARVGSFRPLTDAPDEVKGPAEFDTDGGAGADDDLPFS
ncbi:MAG: hypothetical protein KJ556_21825 [Gammaproteobacteria bacterium]|nr:hypothetical protein [Gammaproteobacteria bacterium]